MNWLCLYLYCLGGALVCIAMEDKESDWIERIAFFLLWPVLGWVTVYGFWRNK